MFSSKKNKNIAVKMERNLVGEGTTLVGDIVSQGDFRIDGTVEGTIKTEGRIIIGKKGTVRGKVHCDNADIEGIFEGDLEVKSLLVLKSTATVSGKVVIGKLMVEPNAVFNATCTMKGAVKELKSNGEDREKQQKKNAVS